LNAEVGGIADAGAGQQLALGHGSHGDQAVRQVTVGGEVRAVGSLHRQPDDTDVVLGDRVAGRQGMGGDEVRVGLVGGCDEACPEHDRAHHQQDPDQQPRVAPGRWPQARCRRSGQVLGRSHDPPRVRHAVGDVLHRLPAEDMCC
jgi:hypothetical protein